MEALVGAGRAGRDLQGGGTFKGGRDLQEGRDQEGRDQEGRDQEGRDQGAGAVTARLNPAPPARSRGPLSVNCRCILAPQASGPGSTPTAQLCFKKV